MEKINFADSAITTEAELRDIVGIPHEHILKKTISFIDEKSKAFIAHSPLLFLATSDRDGNCDVSPRGDGAGSVLVLNEGQLVIPDRPGNRKMDSVMNIFSNPHVGLIFLIPGVEEVLRINGRATIMKDEEILSQMKLKGKAPTLGIGVDVKECFIHCPRALEESKIWKPDEWNSIEDVPSMMDIFLAHLKVNGVEIKG